MFPIRQRFSKLFKYAFMTFDCRNFTFFSSLLFDSKSCLTVWINGSLYCSWLIADMFKSISLPKLDNFSMKSFPSEISLFSQIDFASQTLAIVSKVALLASISCSRLMPSFSKSDNSTEFSKESSSVVGTFSNCSFSFSKLLSNSKDKSE